MSQTESKGEEKGSETIEAPPIETTTEPPIILPSEKKQDDNQDTGKGGWQSLKIDKTPSWGASGNKDIPSDSTGVRSRLMRIGGIGDDGSGGGFGGRGMGGGFGRGRR